MIPHLRSLYLPFLADHVHGVNADARELALQLVDIVALRPEVELCYMGIATKCFEILEHRKRFDGRGHPALGSLSNSAADHDVNVSDEGDEEDVFGCGRGCLCIVEGSGEAVCGRRLSVEGATSRR